MMLTVIALYTVLTAVFSALFYRIGYNQGYRNAKHHHLCGIHTDGFCDCQGEGRTIQGLFDEAS